jgi:hypothetical protein
MGLKLHYPHKFTEEVLSVMRAWGGLRMILDRKDG